MMIELSKEFPALIFLIIHTLCISTAQGNLISPPEIQNIKSPITNYLPPTQVISYPTEMNYWCRLVQSEPQGGIPARPYPTTTTTTMNYITSSGTASTGTISTTTTLS